MLYFDTSYLFRIFSEESGHEAVKHLLNETECVCSALHGRAEFISVIQRKVREGQLGGEALTALVQQFQQECKESMSSLNARGTLQADIADYPKFAFFI